MVKIEIDLSEPEFGFEAKDSMGHVVKMDTSPETGGNNYGARPMQVVLMALGGCSGIDIVSILKKQRQTITHFKMLVEAERETGKDLALWESAKIIFEFDKGIDEDKAKRAVQLSMEKYCSVAETLRKADCLIDWEVRMVD